MSDGRETAQNEARTWRLHVACAALRGRACNMQPPGTLPALPVCCLHPPCCLATLDHLWVNPTHRWWASRGGMGTRRHACTRRAQRRSRRGRGCAHSRALQTWEEGGGGCCESKLAGWLAGWFGWVAVGFVWGLAGRGARTVPSPRAPRASNAALVVAATSRARTHLCGAASSAARWAWLCQRRSGPGRPPPATGGRQRGRGTSTVLAPWVAEAVQPDERNRRRKCVPAQIAPSFLSLQRPGTHGPAPTCMRCSAYSLPASLSGSASTVAPPAAASALSRTSTGRPYSKSSRQTCRTWGAGACVSR